MSSKNKKIDDILAKFGNSNKNKAKKECIEIVDDDQIVSDLDDDQIVSDLDDSQIVSNLEEKISNGSSIVVTRLDEKITDDNNKVVNNLDIKKTNDNDNVKKIKKKKCNGIDRYKNNCIRNQLKDGKFCKNHEYMKDYTKEMMINLTLCSGCLKLYFLIDSKICDNCTKRAEENRKKTKKNRIKCKFTECKSKKSKENDYCGKHQKYVNKDEAGKDGKRMCTNFSRGCKNILDSDCNTNRCKECNIKQNLTDKNLRDKIKNKIAELEDKNKQICTTCGSEDDKKNFIGIHGQSVLTCIKCRDINKKADKKDLAESAIIQRNF